MSSNRLGTALVAVAALVVAACSPTPSVAPPRLRELGLGPGAVVAAGQRARLAGARPRTRTRSTR